MVVKKGSVVPYPLLQKRTSPSAVAVAILIPFRNEAPHLKILQKQLQEAISQSPSSIHISEVVWIDDHSEDGGKGFLEENKAPYEIILPSAGKGKKQALITGEQLPLNADYIIYLDADITIDSHFLKQLMDEWEHESPIMIGKIDMSYNGFWSYFWSCDYHYQQYLGRFLGYYLHQDYWVSGAFWIKKKGLDLDSELQYSSGDDFFALRSAVKQGYAVQYLNTSIQTPAPADFNLGWNQRKRWASKLGGIWSGPVLASTMVLMLAVAFHLLLVSIASFWFCITYLLAFSVVQAMLFGFSNYFKGLLFGILYPIYLMATPLLKWGRFEWKSRTLKQ